MYIPAIINLIKDPIVIVADSIAHNGVSFRAAILTGKFPSKVGYEFTPVSSATAKVLGNYGTNMRRGVYHADKAVGLSTDNMSLPLHEVTLPRALKRQLLTGVDDAGYRTLMLGEC